MELALSLGNKEETTLRNNNTINTTVDTCMGSTAEIKQNKDNHVVRMIIDDDHRAESKKMEIVVASSSSSDPTAGVSPRRQLDLLPFSPVIPRPLRRFPWLSDNLSSEDRRQEGGDQSSPNSGTSSFMEFYLYTKRNNENNGGNVEGVMVGDATTSRGGSDDEENGYTRKKLRLSKLQSSFLEESFKEHHTLNPKQKQTLAKELNLRPRQVEVWFQNRRARTKLKQTEVDCEYLKRCFETLTEENRKLQKELQELRALKSSQPFFMHHPPPTTLTMCPSCKRVAPTATSSPAPAAAVPISTVVAMSAGLPDGHISENGDDGATLCLGKPKSMVPGS